MADAEVKPEFEARPGVTVVDQSNFAAYVDDKLGLNTAPADEAVIDPEVQAAEDLKKVEAEKAARVAEESAPKEGDEDGNKVYFKGKWTGKNDFAYRLHVKTEEVRKEESAKVASAAAEAKAARETADMAEKAAADLRAKYESPIEATEQKPEPQPADYADMAEYAKDLKAWSADNALREHAAKQAEAKAKQDAANVTKTWNERQAAIKVELPDYEQKIATSDVKVSDQLRDAIIESEYGPKILYHLAENPDVAVELGKLSVKRMLIEFGKLETKIGSAAKPPPKSETKPEPVAQISRAPAPITPLNGGGNPGTGLKIDKDGNWTGTYEEFKAADRAGKFK